MAGAEVAAISPVAESQSVLTPKPSRRTCVYCEGRLACKSTEIITAEGKMSVFATKCENKKDCIGHREDPSGICCDVCGFFGPVYNLEKKKFLHDGACSAAPDLVHSA